MGIGLVCGACTRLIRAIRDARKKTAHGYSLPAQLLGLELRAMHWPEPFCLFSRGCTRHVPKCSCRDKVMLAHPHGSCHHAFHSSHAAARTPLPSIKHPSLVTG